MNTSAAFDWLCDQLVQRTKLSPTEARGTLRLMLKELGLDPQLVSKSQLLVLIERRLHAALARIGVAHDDGMLLALADGLRAAQLTESTDEAPEDVFARFGKL